MSDNLIGKYACRLCWHDQYKHNLTVGCPYCKCAATPSEAEEREATDRAILPPDQYISSHYKPDFPVDLPYAGTSGHSGTDTSEERAVKADSTGKTGERQQWVLNRLGRGVSTDYGLTVKDVREMTGWHHGVASSVLTTLHVAGRIVRLAEKRDRCHIYVLPQYADGREVSPYTPNKRNRSSADDEHDAETYRKGYEAGYEAASAAPEHPWEAEYRREANEVLAAVQKYLEGRAALPSNVAWVSDLNNIIEKGQGNG